MSIREAISQKILETGGRLRVRSALNPILWLCAIVIAPSLYFATQTGDHPIWLIVLIFLPVGTAIAGFLFLLFVDRDKLQSEDYQIRKKTLELIQEKGEVFSVSTASIEKISNPGLPGHQKPTVGDSEP